MSFFAELKRRNVFKVGMAYVIVAWLLIQVASIIVPAYQAPGWVMPIIITLIFIGFPLALILAWAFELTPEGIKPTQTVIASESIRHATGQKLNYFIIVLLSVAVIFLIVDNYVWVDKVGKEQLSKTANETAKEASVPGETSQIKSTAAANTIRSIAVLPLDNYSGDPGQDYFAEGMTDQLTTDLAMISRLRVISRGSTTRFKGEKRPSTPEIARLLHVDAVVEGSVLRVGDRVRITAQLIDAAADKHLWAKSFEANSSDVLALQDHLASAIAHEINVQLTPGEQSRLSNSPNVVPEAYDAYLKGRYFFARLSDENIRKAITQFKLAVKLDPKFALAYSGLSDSYVWAGFNEGVYTATEMRGKTRETAERSIQLDDTSAEAHNSLAVYLGFYDYNWAGSESEFRKAIALNPNYAYAHDQFAVTLAFQGRLDEALAESERAAALDPLNPLLVIDAAMPLTFAGKYAEARDRVKHGMYLDPEFFYGPWLLGWIYVEEGRSKDAIPDLRHATELDSPAYTLAWLGYAYGTSGDRAQALATIDAMKQRFPGGRIPPYCLALVHLGLGEYARALTDLDRARAADTQWLGFLKMSHLFDPLRSDPRFHVLMKQAGFEPPSGR